MLIKGFVGDRIALGLVRHEARHVIEPPTQHTKTLITYTPNSTSESTDMALKTKFLASELSRAGSAAESLVFLDRRAEVDDANAASALLTKLQGLSCCCTQASEEALSWAHTIHWPQCFFTRLLSITQRKQCWKWNTSECGNQSWSH